VTLAAGWSGPREMLRVIGVEHHHPAHRHRLEPQGRHLIRREPGELVRVRNSIHYIA
jgi:hypothetical protein